MRIRIRVCVEPQPAPDAIFANVFLPLHRSWGARLGSAVLHIVLIAVIPSAFQLLTPVPDFQWNKFDVKPIDVRIPVYFTAPAPERVERQHPDPAKGQPAEAEPAAETASHTAPPAHLELPPLPAHKKAETVLLQPNVPMP